MATTITCNRCGFTVTADNVLDAVAADQAHQERHDNPAHVASDHAGLVQTPNGGWAEATR